MDIKIYHMFHKPEHYAHLERNANFIPYNNIINEQPELYEYPIMKKVLDENLNFNGHWGIISWKWRQKTGISGDEFIDWMQKNSGYDVYAFNPWIDVIPMNNCFIHGEYYHPGMIQYVNSLLNKLGYNIDIQNVIFPINIISFCNFYVGNKKFWQEWISFCDLCIEVTKQDAEMYAYMFQDKSYWRDSYIINFAFIVERLVCLFLYLNLDKFKVKHFPYMKRFSGEYYEQFADSVRQKTLDLYKEHI